MPLELLFPLVNNTSGFGLQTPNYRKEVKRIALSSRKSKLND